MAVRMEIIAEITSKEVCPPATWTVSLISRSLVLPGPSTKGGAELSVESDVLDRGRVGQKTRTAGLNTVWRSGGRWRELGFSARSRRRLPAAGFWISVTTWCLSRCVGRRGSLSCFVHLKCYVYYVVNRVEMVNKMPERELEREAELVLCRVLHDLADVHVRSCRPSAGAANHLTLDVVSGRVKFQFAVQAKSRVTPQTALSACQQFEGVSKKTIRVVFAPTISPRVAEILREQGIGHADRAGNCWLHSPHHHLLIDRRGSVSERQATPAAVDPFSTKSSRIVRTLLSEPQRGWRVRELANDSQVRVSAGLVVKVKRALVEEGYAVERDRKLFLRDPIALLKAWARSYSGPAAVTRLYFRGDVAAAELGVSRWCQANALRYALAGFSAAWRLAPEVRYSVATVYVDDAGFDPKLMAQLAAEYGGKPVDTGPNLLLWRPFDPSVFAGVVSAGKPEQQVSSALQTYLDLCHQGGRGEDAAMVLFEKHLGRLLNAAAVLEGEISNGGV